MDSPLSSGTKLGRYEIRSKIGAGGMGEVYLAQDTKLDRKVALKILPADVASDSSRMKRFVQEARSASALNHPNIITIYEIDETDSGHFIATEFIDGETLREHSLTASLTVAASLDIAIQIANALAAAHAAGIVHRDIKPENVMVRRDGIVKVLDFGLAKLSESRESGPEEATRPLRLTRTGVVMGTVTHMSPEQTRGQPVDARSDIWSFGVLLYELLAQRLPFDGSNSSDIIVSILEREPAPLSSVSPAVPADLQRIITKTLRKDREERYQSIQDLLVDLKTLRRSLDHSSPATADARSTDRGKRTETVASATPASGLANTFAIARSKMVLAVATVVIVIAALAAYFLFYKNRAPLTEKDTILLADFVNTTGDATFDGSTLKQALAVQLRQTPFVNLLPEESVRETLRYMNHPEDERITKQIGAEICRRRGLKALLVGSIASIGSNYAITLEAVNGQTGETIASQQIEAERKEQVLKSLGQAALELRKQLGESLASLQKYNAPIEQATTSSLEALNAYSRAREIWARNNNAKEALIFYNRAIELDPNFAEAYEWAAWALYRVGDYRNTTTFAEKAYALRERVTEREKFAVTSTYHHFVTGDFQQENESNELCKRVYPNDWVAYDDLAINYNATGQFDRAVTEANEVIRLNPNAIQGYAELFRALIYLNRFDDARQVAQQAQERKLDSPYLRNYLYLVFLAQGNADAQRQQLELIAKDSESSALSWKARAATILGRWREAERHFRQIAELPAAPQQTGKAAALLLPEAAQRKAAFGFCQPDDESIAQALSPARVNSPGSFLNFPVLPNGSLCGEISVAEKLTNEVAKRYPNSTLMKGLSLPAIRAAIELKRDQPEQAIEYLKATAPYEGGGHFFPTYLRGQAYLRLHRGSEAAAEFQKILDHRGWDIASQLYPLAYLGLARSAALRGDAAEARKHYDEFFAFWKDADQNLPILIEAKSEYQSSFDAFN